MRAKKMVLSGFVCALLVGAASATIFVSNTAAAYCGVCEPLDGVPGVLQRVGFIPGGNCKRFVRERRCIPQQCEVSGRKGFCKTRHVREGERERTFCACEPYKISR